MKKVTITVFLAFFCILFCEAQQETLQEALERQRQEQIRQQRDAQLRREAEAQRLRELDLLYQNTIASAERNIAQRQFAQARQDYFLTSTL